MSTVDTIRNLRIALTDVPRNLDPYQSNTLHIHTVMWPIYEPLFDIGHDGQLIPRLATHWDVLNRLEYRFHLRMGVGFHGNGGQFDANAVVQNLLRAKSQRSSFRERILAGLIEDLRAEPEGTVWIRLRYPKPELLFLALMTSDKGKTPLGTGPFELLKEGGLVLKRNDNYYLPRQGNLDQISFIDVSGTDPIEALKRLELDFIRDVDPDRVAEIPDGQLHSARPFGLHYLGFNVNGSIFREREAREAFRDVIDFTRIQSDTGLEPAKGPIPPGIEAYDPTLSTRREHLPDARRTLKRACGQSPITLLFNENSYYGLDLAKCIEADLAASDVNVKRDAKQSSSELVDLLQRLKEQGGEHGNYVFIYNWYSILPAAEIFLRPLFERGMPDNLTDYKELGTLFKDGESGISEKELIKRYRDAQRRIVHDVPAIFLGYSKIRYSAQSEKVTGLKLNVQSFPVDRYVGVDVHP